MSAPVQSLALSPSSGNKGQKGNTYTRQLNKANNLTTDNGQCPGTYDTRVLSQTFKTTKREINFNSSSKELYQNHNSIKQACRD
jgi:hypothetical protein